MACLLSISLLSVCGILATIIAREAGAAPSPPVFQPKSVYKWELYPISGYKELATLWKRALSETYYKNVDVEKIIIAFQKNMPENYQRKAYIIVKVNRQMHLVHVDGFTGITGKLSVTKVDNFGQINSDSSSSSSGW